MKTKTKYVFNRKKKLNPAGEGLIELEIYQSSKKRYLRSSGIWILPEFWEESTKTVSQKHKNQIELNHYLVEFKYGYDYFFAKQAILKKPQDITLYEEKKNLDIPLFFDFFEKEVINGVNLDLNIGTQRVYHRTLKYLRQYSNDISFEAADVSFLHGFNRFLTTEKKLHNNTRAGMFSKIRKVFNYAIQRDYITYNQNPFNKGFSVKEIPSEATSLTIEELTKIENLDMSLRPELDRIRDMFLFSCYTSIRYGDLIKLTNDNFEFLTDNRIRLTYYPSKTQHLSNKKIQWILSDFWGGKIDEIVLKYHELSLKSGLNNYAFFKITNEYYNRQLKELQRFAGIEQKITSHLARHTCVSLLLNHYNVPMHIAQMIAGHSKIEQTRKYLFTSERDISNIGKRINWDL